ncbi:helix-turn-helix transcriptional regulator [Corallococcus exercitus]|uniref:Helix-turn-helix transcriptional regulator n=2 Tax=Corallococcus exercitus TaxID=2316736 RepID=A0A7Y4KEX8_9BACT|nr:helix-turn-helix transcriptional regulator [Corallococcus exercitus]
MARNLGNVAAAPFPVRPCGFHELIRDEAWGARDCVCGLGIRARRSQGVHPRARIAVILSGTFQARSSQGEMLVGPGTFLLGNAAAEYEYRHVDDGGDRSLVFDYGEALLEEVGRSLGVHVRGGRSFGRVAVPASPGSVRAVALAHEALRDGGREALREAALLGAQVVLSEQNGGVHAVAEPSATQVRQVARLIRYIEAHSAGDCSLDALAALAGLSRFHFLRIFQRQTGQTPRQYVIATRLRVAATTLRTTRLPVTQVSLDVGFGDLSHFTTSFTQAFGASPRAYRLRHAPRTSSRRG